MSTNIKKHSYKTSVTDRRKLNEHNSFLIWFTGLSGSGKSTIANALEEKLHNQKFKTYVLDGDNIRKNLNKDLSFSPNDRKENIRRVAEVSKLMIDAGLIVIAAFISPYRKDRENVKATVQAKNFIEVFVDTSLFECERRDVKGLYKKSKKGEITNMTGLSSPYEVPLNPDIVIKTEEESVDLAVDKIMSFIKPKLSI